MYIFSQPEHFPWMDCRILCSSSTEFWGTSALGGHILSLLFLLNVCIILWSQNAVFPLYITYSFSSSLHTRFLEDPFLFRVSFYIDCYFVVVTRVFFYCLLFTTVIKGLKRPATPFNKRLTKCINTGWHKSQHTSLNPLGDRSNVRSSYSEFDIPSAGDTNL